MRKDFILSTNNKNIDEIQWNGITILCLGPVKREKYSKLVAVSKRKSVLNMNIPFLDENHLLVNLRKILQKLNVFESRQESEVNPLEEVNPLGKGLI